MCSNLSIQLLNRFPLYSKGVDTYRFEYAVFLLNKDIELVSFLSIFIPKSPHKMVLSLP